MTNDTQTTEPTTTETTRDEGLDAGKLAGALFGIGASWARYGLAIGRASLAATAVTLETTSDLLGRLSRTLDETAEQVRDGGKPTT